MIPGSGFTERRHIKECLQAPFLSFSPPYRVPLARLTDFSYRPISHLGAGVQATPHTTPENKAWSR